MKKAYLHSLSALFLALAFGLHAEEPAFEAELFEIGTLVYSDDFDGEWNHERWGAPKGKKIEGGKLIMEAEFTNREEAMKALKRDHQREGSKRPSRHLQGWRRLPHPRRLSPPLVLHRIIHPTFHRIAS